jgi:AbrB family looped-hinge helix DNA binding protein
LESRPVELVRLDEKGQVSIPRAILEKLGLEGGHDLIVEATADGAIVLRPAETYPVEIYTDERIAEFLAENEIDPELDRKVQSYFDRRR